LNTFLLKSLILSNAKNEPDAKKAAFGYSFKSLVLMSFMNYVACKDSDFNWYYSPQYGNCFQFNMNASHLYTAAKTGSKQGLMLVLFTGLLNDSRSLSFDVGWNLFIHNQSHWPSSGAGVSVAPGSTTNIGITRTFTDKQPFPYNQCLDGLTTPDKFDSFYYRETLKSGYVYRQVDCLNLVEQDYYIKNCSCAEPSYPTLYGTRYCETTSENFCVLGQYISIYSSGNNIEWTKYCPLECDTLDYTLTTSWSEFPSETMAEIFLDQPEVIASIADSIAYVKIFYSYTGYTLMIETPSQGPIDLLSSLGGTMGLYMGVSFLSFVEVVELLIKIGALTIKHFSRDRKAEDALTPRNTIEERPEKQSIGKT
jgi:amiloride-sensitive sodium channel subunit alpha/amiloride-sensitive sodium channel subunit gamma